MMSLKPTPSGKVRLATVWLDGCSGCHMSLLDIDEVLLDVAPRFELVFSPLMDAQVFPSGVDVTLVEGAVSSQDDLKLAQKIRLNSRMVVALGDCAVTSNVPSMRNTIPVRVLLDRVYVQGADTNTVHPSDGIPQLGRHVVPLHEVIKVDLHVPGCPPKPAIIAQVITQLLDGKKCELAGLVKFG
jgi:NAD-reducing hydrogenase small subunit